METSLWWHVARASSSVKTSQSLSCLHRSCWRFWQLALKNDLLSNSGIVGKWLGASVGYILSYNTETSRYYFYGSSPSGQMCLAALKSWSNDIEHYDNLWRWGSRTVGWLIVHSSWFSQFISMLLMDKLTALIFSMHVIIWSVAFFDLCERVFLANFVFITADLSLAVVCCSPLLSSI